MIVEYTTAKGVKKKWVLQAAVFSALRRLSYRTPMRSAVMAEARVSRGKYKCAICKKIFGRKQIAIDHIEPVNNPLTGFTTWDDYINRLFCPAGGLNLLCNNGKQSCHKLKSKEENKVRSDTRKKKKLAAPPA